MVIRVCNTCQLDVGFGIKCRLRNYIKQSDTKNYFYCSLSELKQHNTQGKCFNLLNGDEWIFKSVQPDFKGNISLTVATPVCVLVLVFGLHPVVLRASPGTLRSQHSWGDQGPHVVLRIKSRAATCKAVPYLLYCLPAP